MTKFAIKSTAFALILCTAMLTGCAKSVSVDIAGSKKPIVYASFYPMFDLTKKAAGDFAEVRCLIPDSTEPHDWEPSPKDITGLKKADVFVYSGAGFETWVDSVLPNVQNKELVVVEASKGIKRSENGDPHTWLNPLNAKQQFIAICEALKIADPTHAEDYAKNEQAWVQEFDKLDQEFQSLRDLPKNKILVTHAAFGYLCDAYGLEQISPLGYSPEAEPDPASMAEAVAKAKENDIKYVLYEGANPELANTLASELGAEVLRLSSLEHQAIDGDKVDDYFKLMRLNLAALKVALK